VTAQQIIQRLASGAVAASQSQAENLTLNENDPDMLQIGNQMQNLNLDNNGVPNFEISEDPLAKAFGNLELEEEVETDTKQNFIER
jgi:hypothetical protein